MTDTADVRKSSVYLILERPKWRNDPPRVAGMRKEKPALDSGQVAVKLTLRVDMSWFNEFIPEVVADIEPGDIIVPEIEVEEAPERLGNDS